jgi:diadenosine tetraphosphatase ApaH/serine/threonine PP2A family protein phosphatase
MRVALLADIHANREALEACLDDAQEAGADRYVFLGDIVGYGGDPGAVVDIVQHHAQDGAVVILGNHDAAIAKGGEQMNPIARAAIDWTREQLDDAQRAFLADLPLSVTEEDRLYVHAEASSPRNWIYVMSATEAEASLAGTQARVTFCGHIHRPQLYSLVRGKPIVSYTITLDKGVVLGAPKRWLVVLGSVGQPRNRDPAAAYAMFDDTTQQLTFRAVPYDIEAAAQKIRDAHLPAALAHRLFVGL